MEDENSILYLALAVFVAAIFAAAAYLDSYQADMIRDTGRYILNTTPSDMAQDAGEWYDAQKE